MSGQEGSKMMTREQRGAAVRVAKNNVRLATSGMDPDGLVAMCLEEIPVQISFRQARTRMGFFKSEGDQSVGRIVLNAHQCATEADFMGTLYHELAHAVNHWLRGRDADTHGPQWKSIMVQLGQPPSRCFSGGE
jgi:SprT-like family